MGPSKVGVTSGDMGPKEEADPAGDVGPAGNLGPTGDVDPAGDMGPLGDTGPAVGVGFVADPDGGRALVARRLDGGGRCCLVSMQLSSVERDDDDGPSIKSEGAAFLFVGRRGCSSGRA